ncbi:MAG: hypothetical protein E7082_07465 [Bacteroidales bacterium]|nr:hypothetical protein [Bacteroidales bacterium]
MKGLKLLLPAIAAAFTLTGCLSDEIRNWNDYADWREANEEWYHDQLVTGQYTKVTPEWNPELSILMRWFNDREKTAENLTPLYTSSVSVKYKGWLYDGTPFDSSYVNKDSLVTLLPSSVISGWVIALEQMHVGDWVEIIIPYQAAYGSSSIGVVNPYSALRFELELRDIPTYEVRPKTE